jgi:cell division protein FtsI (penicillin-binding protein 3)
VNSQGNMTEPKKDILWRIRLVYFVTALFAVSILMKVIYIQVAEGEHWREVARTATMRYASIDAARGDIRADDGRLLATSIPIYEIRMDMSQRVVSDEVFHGGLDSLALGLSRLFHDRSPGQYRAELLRGRREGDRYFLVKRNVSYNQLTRLRELPVFRLGRYRGGLIVSERTRREMPYRTLAARTIGYEREGVYVGLEGAYREYLEGTQGKRLMQRTSGGNWMPINDDNEIQPKNGMDLITTINIRMQDFTENALRKQLSRYQASWGTAVIMETATGKIKAISNLTRNSHGTYEETYNYAVGESAEPGSTFKLASVMALLEDGLASPGDTVHTGNGRTTYSGQVMRDAREGGHGSITLQEAFALSSNVGISRFIYEAYHKNPQRFVDRIRGMGLDKPLGLEITGEGVPLFKDAGSPGWSGTSLPWMSIGYELTMTPLQTLSLYNAVANGGRMMRPMMVEEIRQTGKVVKHFQPETIHRSVASQRTLETVREMLVEVVTSGTAKNIHTPAYQIAGKTGTAQVASDGTYRGQDGVTYQASFAGYFPAEDPRYSGIVVIYNPRGWIYTGSQVAAPVFREIADKIVATEVIRPGQQDDTPLLAHLPSFRNGHLEDIRHIYEAFDCRLNDQAQTAWGSTQVRSDTVSLQDKTMMENLVPDVTGMGLRDALYLLENAGMRVRFSGRGTVRRQSIQPGLRISPGSVITLELN